jgi:hypothetical protein
VLAPVAWALATVGYFGPWIAHETAALTLSGVDMGEFVKFLPPVMDNSLRVVRQLFYLPPVAVVSSVALLACSRELRYPWTLRVLALALAVPVSLQLLPPAWSPATLMSTEFRLQTVTMGVLWLLLAGTWLWGRLVLRLTGLLSAAMALVAAVLSAWQFSLVKPAIDVVYSMPPGIGWGFFVCLIGLAAMTVSEALMAWQSRISKKNPR